MTVWAEQAKTVPEVGTAILVPGIDMRINFAQPVPNWIGLGRQVGANSIMFPTGNTVFGSAREEDRVSGVIVSKGGNGSNRITRMVKSYYWHL